MKNGEIICFSGKIRAVFIMSYGTTLLAVESFFISRVIPKAMKLKKPTRLVKNLAFSSDEVAKK